MKQNSGLVGSTAVLSRRRPWATSLVFATVFLALTCPPGAVWSEEIGSEEAESIATSIGRRHYAEWLKDVSLIMEPSEANVFLNLETDTQREAFRTRFWRVRNPDPSNPGNSMRDEFLRYSRTAWQSVPNRDDDRWKTVVLHGPPSYAYVLECRDLHPLNLFYYPRTQNRTEGTAVLFFLDRRSSSSYRLWSPLSGHGALSPNPAMAELDSADFLARLAREGCFAGREHLQGFLAGALEKARGWEEIRQSARFPRLGDELAKGWLEEFKKELGKNGAVGLASEMPSSGSLAITFPDEVGQHTVLLGVLEVPNSSLPEDPDSSTLTLYGRLLPQVVDREEIDGQLGKEAASRLFQDRFHQRIHFEQPTVGTSTGATSTARTSTFPVTFYRDLAPGAYSMELRLEDANGELLLRNLVAFEVPDQPTDRSRPPAGIRANSDVPEDLALLERRPSLRFRPVTGLRVGEVTLDVVTTGGLIEVVRFELDGKEVGRTSGGTWPLVVNLGTTPELHTVRAVALDAEGAEVAEDTLRLNEGVQRFATRLIEPLAGATYEGTVPTRVVLEVPVGDEVERVELFRNEDLVATLFQPPWALPISLRGDRQSAYIKAVAFLADGTSTEDTAVVNVPGMLDAIEVREVELFASVTDRWRRPVADLTKQEVEVVEQGVRQQIQRLDASLELPLHVGLLIDGSDSMVEEMPLCIETALSFLDAVMRPQDEAAVITFDATTTLVVPLTSDIDWLADGVRTILPSGGTALWDGVVNAVNYFGGLQGQRSIILISDGDDQLSHFALEDAIGYAQRSGVSIYTLFLIPPSPMVGDPFSKGGTTVPRSFQEALTAVRSRLKELSKSTGGLSFDIHVPRDLRKAFNAIEEDLRSQYLIAYRSSNQGTGYRSVELQFTRSGVKARSIAGYTP
ncbi:MAG: VWA domain-containing protein [Thermoanaerobaculia bacterium]|nr:VWA domain-containing protein [Thermoanaerobaculia bacterium]